MLSLSEEDYLKTIFKLSEKDRKPISTNVLAKALKITPASTTEMIKRLSNKNYLNYRKYYGVKLTDEGIKEAMYLTRKHRLWEVFLVDKLQFSWDEVHEIAEQLEHIKSEVLVNKLDEFLGFPKYDPHGDAIPDKRGRVSIRSQIPLIQAKRQTKCTVIAVQDHSKPFLKYLGQLNIKLGSSIFILDKIEFDNSLRIEVNGHMSVISHQVAQQILIKENNS